MLKLKGVFFESLGPYGSRVDRHFEVPWTEAAALELFSEFNPQAKDEQTLWAPSTYKEGANRGNAGLLANHAAILDKDCADIGELDWTVKHLQAQGLAFMVYTSWSHRLPEKTHADTHKVGPFDCFRVVLPFDRDLVAAEYTAVINGLFGYELPPDPPNYAEEVNGLKVVFPNGRSRAARPRGWDPVSSRPAQGFYVPTPWAEMELYDGAPLDTTRILLRPSTPRMVSKTERPYLAPDEGALGALSEFDQALRRLGFGLGRPGYSGWARSKCPSCEDPSPSLTARANGEGVDLKCHAGCRRFEILESVGLEEHDLLRKEPGALRIGLEEQLARQVPAADAVTVSEAVDRLEVDLRAALQYRQATVLKYPAGTGKSYCSAKVIAEEVSNGYRVCYSTQEHRVAHETRMHLPAAVRSQSVHVHSPLIQVGDEPPCMRAEELKERVFEFGLSLQGKVCPSCSLRSSCAAHAAARARAARVKSAAVVFVSHAGINQVIAADRGHDMKLIVDEMPSAFVELRVTKEQLEQLATDLYMPSADTRAAAAAHEIARAWLAAETPGNVVFGTEIIGPAVDIARDVERMRVRTGGQIPADEKRIMQAADRVLRLAVLQADGWVLGGFPALEDGVWAMVPDSCHQALLDRQGVLLSATPLLHALPGFQIRNVEVTDSARVRRVLVLRQGRGSGALTKMFYNDDDGRRHRQRHLEGVGGIPWPIVDAALARARKEAEQYDCKRVLFVTFKAVAEALRADPSRLGSDLSVCHYGALRGKNDWMEGRSEECSVVYCLGSPRFDMRSTLKQLRLSDDELMAAWVDFAAAELAQAEGRLRLPRRAKPCSVIVEGDVVPSTWHPDIIDEIQDRDLCEPTTESGLLADILKHWSIDQLPFEVDVDHGTAGAEFDELLAIARPHWRDMMDVLANHTPGRRLIFDNEFSWTPCAD